MRIIIIVLAALFVLTAAAGIYLYKTEHIPLAESEKVMKQANVQLRRELDEVQKELNVKVAELSKAFQKKEQEIEHIQSTKDSLIQEMASEINDNQIQITQLADKLKVSIVDKILFASGEAKLSDEGLKVLERVGKILNKEEDKIIRVEGHTDNVPISGRLADTFPTNWELSNARATNVVRLLQNVVGVPPERLEAVGMGEYHPVASNEDKEGRAHNRRIEIMLLPGEL